MARTLQERPDIATCRQAYLLYERILSGQRFPIGRWAADKAVIVTSGRFPPNVTVTDHEWLRRMRLLADIVDYTAQVRANKNR